MVYIDLTDDKHFLVVSSPVQLEMSQLNISFSREVSNAWLIKKQNSNANTTRSFINQYGMIPIGCWLYLLNICNKYNLPIQFSDKFRAHVDSFNLDFETFKSYVYNLFDGAENEEGKKFFPYDYQIESAYKLLKYKKACAEISTSAGKTLISFLMFKWLFDTHQEENYNMLYICPSKELATQSYDKYMLYESYLKTKTRSWKAAYLTSGLNKSEREAISDANVLFGTFQTLCKKDHEFLSKYKVVLNDECHHGVAKSLKNIIGKSLSYAEYVFGVTGTFPKQNTIEYMTLISYMGPVVHEYHTYTLIHQDKSGTPVYIIYNFLNYASESDKKLLYEVRLNKNKDDFQSGAKALKTEQRYVNNSYTRLKYICDMAISAKKNTLILFGDIKSGYGRKMHVYIKENSDKNCYYCDGSTPSSNRDEYKAMMEEDETGNTIIVASIGTFGEGIDIKNVWNIMLVNSAKSERLVRQIVGRGLRNYPGKDKTLLFDFVDDFRWSDVRDPKSKYRNNYMWKHYLERNKIYKEQKFETFSQTINFTSQMF